MLKAEAKRAKRLLEVFNISSEEYEKILAHQGGVCAICKQPPKPGKRLHIDHRHQDGLCRGLLDWRCNARLGRENEWEIFANTAEYLRHPPAVLTLGEERFGLPGRVGTKKQRNLIRKMKKLKKLASLQSLKTRKTQTK